MLHPDLRPNNVMIDKSGTVKIIDLGLTRVVGVVEAAPNADGGEMLGPWRHQTRDAAAAPSIGRFQTIEATSGRFAR